MSELLDRITDIRTTCRPRPTFTLERGRGETYSHPRPVLYAHSVYGRGSVLAGQPRRLWVAQWDTWDEARAALGDVRQRDRTFEFDDFGEGGGTTHIPSDVLTRHLPDDEGCHRRGGRRANGRPGGPFSHESFKRPARIPT